MVHAFSVLGCNIAVDVNSGAVHVLDPLSYALVKAAGLIVLAGGHVPTQNAFLCQCGLKEAMKTFDGVVIGISAGSMNCAETVYAQPEEPGEAISKTYRRFLPGLGLTNTMLLPH